MNFDCRRSVVGLALAAREIGQGDSKCATAMTRFSAAYWDQLRDASRSEDFRPAEISDRRPPEASVARKLVADAAAVKRREFIAGLLAPQKTGRQLARGDKFFELTPDDRRRGERLLENYLQNLSIAKRQTLAGAQLLDLCGRVAGCGSLGRYRFVALLAPGDHDAEKSVLLELKESLPSACDECAPAATPRPPRRRQKPSARPPQAATRCARGPRW